MNGCVIMKLLASTGQQAANRAKTSSNILGKISHFYQLEERTFLYSLPDFLSADGQICLTPTPSTSIHFPSP